MIAWCIIMELSCSTVCFFFIEYSDVTEKDSIKIRYLLLNTGIRWSELMFVYGKTHPTLVLWSQVVASAFLVLLLGEFSLPGAGSQRRFREPRPLSGGLQYLVVVYTTWYTYYYMIYLVYTEHNYHVYFNDIIVAWYIHNHYIYCNEIIVVFVYTQLRTRYKLQRRNVITVW